MDYISHYRRSSLLHGREMPVKPGESDKDQALPRPGSQNLVILRSTRERHPVNASGFAHQ